MTKPNKTLAYILAINLFVVSALLYFAAHSKGFPDGHLTELDRFEQPLFYVSSILGLWIGLFLVYLVRFQKSANTTRILFGTLIFLFLTVLIIAGLDWYFITSLDDGVGG